MLVVANQHVTAIEPADGVHCQPQRLEWRRPLGNEIAEEEDTVAAALGWAHGLEKQRQLLCAPVHITDDNVAPGLAGLTFHAGARIAEIR